ncbi:hypothetical protein EJ08DRAFT_337403 [Tothia fuscella]|uniref:F-box domain-containing protein n=1 Tax=Tothia fuscella TaxID=1048955 RepID=A0A9P4U3Y5_9PEZI|nr:hypothetical protein EJ08DRAFT_337403 [Tothia fuscella]
MTPSCSSLLMLPTELKEQITEYLDLEALEACRLVDQDLKEHSLRSFQFYFNTVTTTLHPDSLQRLINISNYQDFTNAIHIIDIKPEDRHEGILEDLNSTTLKWILQSGHMLPPYSYQYTRSYLSALASGTCTALLKRALRNCSYLEDVTFSWQPSSKVAISSELLTWNRNELDHLTRMQSTVLGAIIDSGVKLRTLMWCSSSERWGALTPKILEIGSGLMSRLRPALENLKDLDLCLQAEINVPRNAAFLTQLLELTPNLSHLILSLDTNVYQERNYLLEGMCQATVLPSLCEFELNCNGFYSTELALRFLRKHASTLKCLVLRDAEYPFDPVGERLETVIIPMLKTLRRNFRLETIQFGIDEEQRVEKTMAKLWPIEQLEESKEGVKNVLTIAIEAFEAMLLYYVATGVTFIT